MGQFRLAPQRDQSKPRPGEPNPRRVRRAACDRPLPVRRLLAVAGPLLVASRPRVDRPGPGVRAAIAPRPSSPSRDSRPRARAIIRDLLEPGESLADASTWADENSREIRGSAGLAFRQRAGLGPPLRSPRLPAARVRRLQDRRIPGDPGRSPRPAVPAADGAAILRPSRPGPPPADARRRSKRPRGQQPPAPLRTLRQHQPAPGLGFRLTQPGLSQRSRARARAGGSGPPNPNRATGSRAASKTGPTRASKSAAAPTWFPGRTRPSAPATRIGRDYERANLPWSPIGSLGPASGSLRCSTRSSSESLPGRNDRLCRIRGLGAGARHDAS